MLKKRIVWILVIVLLAILSANWVYERYQKEVYEEDAGNIYFLQQGVYTNTNSIQNIKASYITVKQDKKYYTYVGMSTSKENAQKIQKYYEKQNIPVYIKSVPVQNQEFLSELSQYDILIESSNDEELPNILETVLATYEEIFMTS